MSLVSLLRDIASAASVKCTGSYPGAVDGTDKTFPDLYDWHDDISFGIEYINYRACQRVFDFTEEVFRDGESGRDDV
jgi:hypothetical protein